MIGTFSKRVLLTGAGWSRNWGGQLASEVWQSLVGHPAVRENARLRDLLLGEPSFEVALGQTYSAPFTDIDRRALEQAVFDAFVSMDREIARPNHDPWINIYRVQEFLFKFCHQPRHRDAAAYLFTLNQDLFFERYLYNEHVYDAPGGALPGLVGVPGRRWFGADLGAYSDDFLMRPVSDPWKEGRIHGQTNVIKLHGSFNWRSADGRNVMVIGTGKTAQIASVPLLAWYAEIFRQVLCAGGVRLMIIGYGFGDEHVNRVIAEAVDNHGLSVFIWSTASNLRDRVLASPHGASIWKGLISTASRPLIEVFPSNQAVTEEYSRICTTFFT